MSAGVYRHGADSCRNPAGTLSALRKLHKKNLDLIVLNSLKDSNACFGYDTNKVTIIDRNEVQWQYELKSKKEVAHDIVDRIVQLG